jgi:enolase
MIVPISLEGFAEAPRAAVETYWALADVLPEEGLRTSVGDEGGSVRPLSSVGQGLPCTLRAIEGAGYRPGRDIALAPDPAAGEFHDGQEYVLTRADGTRLSSTAMVEWSRRLVHTYPIVSTEDGPGESDWDGRKLLTETIGGEVLPVGGDIFVTDSQLIRGGVAQGEALGSAAPCPDTTALRWKRE